MSYTKGFGLLELEYKSSALQIIPPLDKFYV